ncbi:MAG TPA: hypothetical protein VNE83_03555 [Terriglobales bacterium]|nr:hypothetical protein [Terriglobales bacterium]
MSDIGKARKALAARIVEGAGASPHALRHAAFNHANAGLAGPPGAVVDKVARHADTVTGEDFAAAKASGLSEDQIFEIVVCAAVGQATRQYNAALAALDAAAGAGTKARLAMIHAISRQPVLDVVKLVKYRANFYGAQCKRSPMRRDARARRLVGRRSQAHGRHHRQGEHVRVVHEGAHRGRCRGRWQCGKDVRSSLRS